MEIDLFLKALLLGIVEGLTEFLPVSSTGHLILVGELLDFNDAKGAVFEIAIQLAAILAVCWEYRRKIGAIISGLPSDPAAQRFAVNIAAAFVPAAVLGVIFLKTIKQSLFSPIPVAIALIVGGLLILWVEKREHKVRIEEVDQLSWRDALKVGLVQTLALIPGTSRSGATIIGGLYFGLSRKAATEFSFFLAIPTMFAATIYDVYRHTEILHVSDFGMFAVGFIASFISAFIAIRGLLRYISRHDFSAFAWYRIALGASVLLYTALNVSAS